MERIEKERLEKERLEKDRSATERELVDAIVIASYASTWTTDKSVDAIDVRTIFFSIELILVNLLTDRTYYSL